MQVFTLQFAGGSGAAAGASVAACAAVPDEADTLGFRPGAIIGAPRFAGEPTAPAGSPAQKYSVEAAPVRPEWSE